LSESKNRIVLIGGGGHCASCIDVIEQQGEFQIAGIIDKADFVGKEVLGYSIIGSDEDLENIISEYSFFLIAYGSVKFPAKRIELYKRIKRLGGKFPMITSPRAYVSRSAVVGEGTIIMHDCLINSRARIGANCIINTKSLIEHDAVIGDHCHISTRSVVNGGAVIGAETFFGSNAVAVEYIQIAKNSFIKAGSLVSKSRE